MSITHRLFSVGRHFTRGSSRLQEVPFKLWLVHSWIYQWKTHIGVLTLCLYVFVIDICPLTLIVGNASMDFCVKMVLE
jgi:hypothetical protein